MADLRPALEALVEASEVVLKCLRDSGRAAPDLHRALAVAKADLAEDDLDTQMATERDRDHGREVMACSCRAHRLAR